MSNITKGDNAKSKKGRVVILVRDTSSGPVLHFYQVSSKYSKGYSSYRADKKFTPMLTPMSAGSVPKAICHAPFGRGDIITNTGRIKLLVHR